MEQEMNWYLMWRFQDYNILTFFSSGWLLFIRSFNSFWFSWKFGDLLTDAPDNVLSKPFTEWKDNSSPPPTGTVQFSEPRLESQLASRANWSCRKLLGWISPSSWVVFRLDSKCDKFRVLFNDLLLPGNGGDRCFCGGCDCCCWFTGTEWPRSGSNFNKSEFRSAVTLLSPFDRRKSKSDGVSITVMERNMHMWAGIVNFTLIKSVNKSNVFWSRRGKADG